MESIELLVASLKISENAYNFLLKCQNESGTNAIESIINFTASNQDEFKTLASFVFEIFAQNGNLDAMKFMVEQGKIDPGVDSSALLYACQTGKIDIVQYLIENGADPAINGNLPIIFACANGHKDVVIKLISHGADVHAFDETPLIMAIRYGHKDIFKLLYEEYGANPYAQNNIIFKEACLSGNISMLQLYFELGIQILRDGVLLLSVCAGLGFSDILQLLIENGVNPKDQNLLAFATAVEYDKIDSLSFLCEVLPEDEKLSGSELRHLLKHAEDFGVNFRSECCKFLRKALNITFESQFPIDIDIVDQCPVCLGNSNLILGCRHCICGDCLQQLNDNLCPFCRIYIDRLLIKRRK
uniref:RING-type domain-containing protein n=1 Tax=viral metagenome TaxID=1070528 RepID=A0A6C0KQ55_9ZZZZ